MRRETIKRHMILASAVLAAIGISHQARATSLFWDADGDATTSTGGAGTWDTTSSLWRPGSATGTPLQTWLNDGSADAIFGGTAGTVTLGTSIDANSVQFTGSGAYTLSSTTNTITTGTISNAVGGGGSSPVLETIFANVLGTGAPGATNLTIQNTSAATGAAGATITSLQGMLSMNNGSLNSLTITGPTGGSYLKYNQVRIWNPLVNPFNPGVFDDGSRNAWNIFTTINITGDYAMLAGNTPDNGVAHAGSHNFIAPVHLNNNILLVAASVGNTMQFNGVIDGGGSMVITTNDPALPGAGQGAVVYGNQMTYGGVTRIMNSINGTGGGGGTSFGILRFAVDNALPSTTRLIFGDTGFTTAGAVDLNGTDETVTSLESVSGINAIGVIDGNGSHLHDGRGYRILTINGGLTSTYGAPLGIDTRTGFQLNFPNTNTGSTTLTNGGSTYTAGTVIAGGTVVSKNIINNGTSSPVGVGSVTVSGTSTSQFGTFGGTGQVPGAVVQNQFSHLAPGGPSNVDTANQLTLNGGLTLAGGSDVDLEFNGFGNDTVNTTGLTLTGVDTGANRVVLNMFDLGAGVHNGTFALINYGSLSGGSISNFLLNPPVGFNAAHFTLQDTGSAIDVVVTGEASDITWSGAVSNAWNAGTPTTGTANFNGTGGQTKFFNGDRVTFDDNNGGNYNVVVDAAGVSPATVTINAGGNYTFSGGVVTSTVMSKQSGGIAQINDAQTYSTGATIGGGTLQIGPTGSLSGGAISVGTGATLELSAAGNVSGVASLSFTSATLRADASFATDRNIAIAGTSGLDVDTQANNLTLSGVISGGSTVPFKKDGTGTLLITTPTTTTGAYTVNGGTLALSTGTAGISSGGVTVNSGATYWLRGTQSGYAPTASGGTVLLNNNSTLEFSGESGLLGGSGLTFAANGFINQPSTIQGVDSASRLVTRNFIKNATFVNSGPSATVVHVAGAGVFNVASGSLAVTTNNTEFTGTWQLDSGSSAVLSVGPSLNGGNVETLVGLGYAVGFPAGPTSPVIVNGGTLAVGSDRRNSLTGTANAATNISGAFRSPVTLGGGAIASTGREFAGVDGTGGGTGNASSATPVTARYAADITLTDGTTSSVLLYDPITLANYDNSANPATSAAAAQNLNPTGPRSLQFVTDIPTSNGATPGRADVSSNFNWGNNTTLVVDSGTQTGGVLTFARSTVNPGGSTVTVGSNDTLQINNGSTVALGGTIDALSNGSGNFVNVVDNSGGLLHVTAGTKNIGTLSGSGNTSIDAATTLVVNEATSTATGNFTGSGSLTKVNSGVLTAASVNTGDLTVTGGGVKIAANGTSTGTSHVTTLNLSPSTTLDLTNNKLIVSGGTLGLGTWTGTAYTGITGLVASGRNGGAWNGSGIITSQASAISPHFLTTLAVASNANLGKTTFGGQAVTSSDTLVMYTYAGDANLDGKIDADDYFQIDSNYNKAPSTLNYYKGDFNYDGKINGDDYFIIDSNFVAQTTPFPAAAPLDSGGGAGLSGVAAVPEPASVTALLAVAGVASLRRRRRQQM